MMQQGRTICVLIPDMLIYGEGWKIDGSLLYLEELGVDYQQVSIQYVGDMDYKGWEIYATLQKKILKCSFL